MIPVEMGGVDHPGASLGCVLGGSRRRLHPAAHRDRFASGPYPDLDARKPLGTSRFPAGAPFVPGVVGAGHRYPHGRVRHGCAAPARAETRRWWSYRSAGGTPVNSRTDSSAVRSRNGPPGDSTRRSGTPPRERVVLASRRGARMVRTRVEVQEQTEVGRRARSAG